ncbi:Arc18p [Sporobolomyces koalae]|uniref:Arc18p n=1 Tax=Sporobolomyces koalae TaxID=500713 RepID=UPI003175756B
MPAYHSSYNDPEDLSQSRQIGNLSLLPFSSSIRGAAPTPADPSRPDIISEALSLFRANSLFRNFEIAGNADRVLIYLILFTGDCLAKIGHARVWSAQEAQKHLTTYAIDHFSLPGEPGFPMNNVFVGPPAGDRPSSDSLKSYLLHARQELVLRLVQQVYDPKDESTERGTKPSKWWLSFQRRKFMGKSLSN